MQISLPDRKLGNSQTIQDTFLYNLSSADFPQCLVHNITPNRSLNKDLARIDILSFPNSISLKPWHQ
jgi:hypothetical protein